MKLKFFFLYTVHVIFLYKTAVLGSEMGKTPYSGLTAHKT